MYPGMKEISYESSPAVYLHLYQTPSRAENDPAQIARKLWQVVQELSDVQAGEGEAGVGKAAPPPPIQQTDRQKSNGGGASEGDSAAERSLEHTGERSTRNKKNSRKNEKKKERMETKVSPRREGKEGEEGGGEDAVVGLVYAVTKRTNAARKEMVRGGPDGAASREQRERTLLPIGERRLCVVVSERFGMVNGHLLKQWGCNNNTRVSGVSLFFVVDGWGHG